MALGRLCLLDGWFGGIGLILGGTFGWFTVVPWTGLMESKELGWYLDGLGNKLVVWVVSVWFGVVLV